VADCCLKGIGMHTDVLILPGFGNSGAQHWQSLWELSNPDFKRVQQRDWDNPVCDEWVSALGVAAKDAGSNVVLVAHSLGCLAVAHWACRHYMPIKGALLVAVPDETRPDFPKEIQGFSATPELRLPFPSIVVASTNDPYGSIEHAAHLAHAWGSRFINVGARGHINGDSGLGDWAEGYELLNSLRHC
jgi:predicted alpha/beta hydrolase family esterase